MGIQANQHKCVDGELSAARAIDSARAPLALAFSLPAVAGPSWTPEMQADLNSREM